MSARLKRFFSEKKLSALQLIENVSDSFKRKFQKTNKFKSVLREFIRKFFWPGVQLMSKYIRFRQRKFQEKVIVSEIKRLSLKSLSVRELKKNEKINFFFIFYIEMILRFWRIFSRSPILYTINIKDFMNYIWNLFNLTRLGVGSFEPASLCTFEPCCVYSEQRGPRGAVRPCLPHFYRLSFV